MPPQSFFVARGREKYSFHSITRLSIVNFVDICRKEVDHIWIVPRYCDDTGKSNEQIVKVSILSKLFIYVTFL
jgi:hypothetical protein